MTRRGTETENFVETVIAEHRKLTRPRPFRYLGREFELHPNVFSPFIAPSGYLSLSLIAWPDFEGKSVLDVGCGAGIFTSLSAVCGATRVVGVDVNPAAVRNAAKNTERLGVQEIVDIRQGDLFEPVRAEERFDIIFADLPFTSGTPKDDLEKAFYDPDLQSIRRFLAEVGGILERSGGPSYAYICLSNLEPFDPRPLIQKANLKGSRRLVIHLGTIELYLYQVTSPRSGTLA